jgi:hypothetical protein
MVCRGVYDTSLELVGHFLGDIGIIGTKVGNDNLVV